MSKHLRAVLISGELDTNKTRFIGRFDTIQEFAEWWNAYADVHGQSEITVDDAASVSTPRRPEEPNA